MVLSPPCGAQHSLRQCWLSGSHLVGDLACIVLDGELWQRHLRLRVEWVGAVVVVALLQECVVCGLRWGEEAGKGWAPGSGPVPNSSALIVLVPKRCWRRMPQS